MIQNGSTSEISNTTEGDFFQLDIHQHYPENG
jgi:hypothetical protein